MNRCTAINLDGEQCSRNAWGSVGLCTQHRSPTAKARDRQAAAMEVCRRLCVNLAAGLGAEPLPYVELARYAIGDREERPR